MFFLLVSVNISYGATVHGNVYDLSLTKIDGAKIQVDTIPKQFMISQEGKYSFDIPSGSYTIKAEFSKNGVVEKETRNISISREGSYIIDLILFPSFDEDFKELEISIPETNEEHEIIKIVIILLALIIIVRYATTKTKKKVSMEINESDDYAGKIIEIIKNEHGRATQKQIRKEIPLSEAKISLIISELEHQNKIEKIKKGRGNIIKLK